MEKEKLEPEGKISAKVAEFNKMRIISLALLEASNRYREAFYREEADFMMDRMNKMFMPQISKLPFSKREKKERELIAANVKFRQDLKKFTDDCYKEISRLTKELSKESAVRFDNYATGFAVLMEEFLKAKNTTELLTVCQIYNAGKMDEVFGNLEILQNGKSLNDKNEQKDFICVIDTNNFDEYRKNGWILCSEKLPEEKTKVRVLYENGTAMTSLFWNKEEGFDPYAEPLHIAVIAWKPIEDEVIVDNDHLRTAKNNVGEPLFIPEEPAKLSVVREPVDEIPDSQKSEC